ncbi:MAG: hypothetical protein HC781_22560, partial [Leptolyngbyaceae cyanobacterium CSU_1_4]|nr:hypothetical protein [Leptolyngbyaceae cyanobacterium CSU_1_4]
RGWDNSCNGIARDFWGGEFDASFDEITFRNLVPSEGIKFSRYVVGQGAEFEITKAATTIALPIFDDIIQEADRTFKYAIAPGAGYNVSPTAGSANVTFTDGVPGGGGPTVAMTVDKTALTEKDRFTIKFNVAGTIPAEGVTVYVDGDKFGGLGEFDTAALNLETDIVGTDGRIPRPDGDAGGFLITLTKPEASITLKPLDDGPNEGKETLTFRLRDGENYNIDAAKNTIALNIDDGGTGTGDALPTVGIASTAITVDRQDVLLAPHLVQSAAYTDADGKPQTGVSLLNLVLNLNGSLPSGGIVVNVTSDVDFARAFSNNGRPPTVFGGQVLGAIFNPAGEPIGFQLKLLTPNPVVSLRLNDNVLLTDELRRPTFTVAPGDGYVVDSKAASTRFRVYNDLKEVPAPSVTPEVSFTATNTTLTESEIGDRVTLNFRLSAPPPADGVIVKVTSDGAGSLGDFDLFRASVAGGVYPAAVGSNGFFFKLTSQNATLVVPVFTDEEVEGVESFKFTVQSGFGYTINPSASSTVITIKDTPTSVLPLVSLVGTPATLIESAETVSRHTFNLSTIPPADGVLVAVAAPNLSEFNLDKIKVTGGSIAGVTADGFTLKMIDRTVVIELPVKNDGVTEGKETAVFTLKPGATYGISPTASKAEFSIFDAATAVPLTVETESNDTLEKANLLTLGANGSTISVKGAIDFSTANTYKVNPADAGNTFVDATEDVDLYKVTLKKGDKLAIDLDNAVATNTTFDPVLRLFDAAGKELTASNNDPAPNEIFVATERRFGYINYTAATDGVYYIGVSSSPNFDRTLLNAAQANFDPYDPKVQGSGTGRTTGEYNLNVSLNGSIPKPDASTAPIAPGTGPKISLSTISATYDSNANNEAITAQGIAEVVPSGASVLSLALKADGEIPAAGTEVIINSDVVLREYFRNLGNVPFSVGGQVVGAVYDANTGEATGIKFKMTQPNALINFTLFNNKVEDGSRKVNFSLGNGSYTIDAAAKSSLVTIYDKFDQIPQAASKPEISLEIANGALVESLGNSATLTLKANAPIPADGLVVYVDSGTARVLGQIDVFNIKVTGGSFPAANFRTSGFYFKMTEQTATISLNAFPDGDSEGLQGYDFKVVSGAGYTVSATQNAAPLTIVDSPTASTQTMVSYTGTPGNATTPGTLIEESGTISVHTFTLGNKPPAGGLTVFVKSANLGEFDLTKAAVTGGTIAAITKDGFNLNITERSAVIRVPVKNDGVAEGAETAVFTLEAGSTYLVSPTENKVTYNLVDLKSTTETEGADLLTINDVISQAVDTKLGAGNTSFKTSATIGNAAPNFIDASEDVDLYKVELKVG